MRFPQHAVFLEGVASQHPHNPGAHLRGVLELAGLYDVPSLERALTLGHEYGGYSHGFVRGLLERSATPTTESVPREPSILDGRSLPARLVHGDLQPYQRLLEAAR